MNRRTLINKRVLVAGLTVVALGGAEMGLSAASLYAQLVEIAPPKTRPDVPRAADDWRAGSSLEYGPRFIAPLSVKTDSGRVGIAGWTSPTTTVPPGRPGSHDLTGLLGLGLATEWGTRPGNAHILR